MEIALHYKLLTLLTLLTLLALTRSFIQKGYNAYTYDMAV